MFPCSSPTNPSLQCSAGLYLYKSATLVETMRISSHCLHGPIYIKMAVSRTYRCELTQQQAFCSDLPAQHLKLTSGKPSLQGRLLY